ncbi:MAG: paraslipin [Pseudanabaenales cyanobacterium]|nr:paraslipin [Pseudanabaenales cyanobacterium]
MTIPTSFLVGIFISILIITLFTVFDSLADTRFFEVLLISLALAFVFYSLGSIIIVKQGNEALVERLGRYQRKLGPGLNSIVPFLDSIILEDTTLERIFSISPTLTITKDGVPLEVEVVVFWRILDLERAYYSTEDVKSAIAHIASDNLRAKISSMELEKTFIYRDKISKALLEHLDKYTEYLGIKITRVEIGDILLAKAVLGEVPDTIEFAFHNGIDWSAFKYSFNLIIENEETEFSIQSIEDRGDGVLVVRIKVPTDANKAQIYKDFMISYEDKIKVLEAKYQSELQAKDAQVTLYRQQNADIQEIVKLLANRPVTVEVKAQAESKSMNESMDSSRKIEIGNVDGDFNASGSALNLGDISGILTNTINQIPFSPENDQLKELLRHFQTEIVADEKMLEDDKIEALKQIVHLSKVSRESNSEKKQTLAKRAIQMLRGIAVGLPDATQFVEACSKFLPLIAKLFGLP